ncbi:unnamed protein product [Lepeophtheirus salmonis]|uniref:(salmon louse) hypothetical protein n=1 Tax=Lepeophtheirus salmonis TaxID=72036 RepID=A0A7R8CKW7_LEPSM|nr:unnamed protein product [Lepeophtheirus salmonis]CAF2852404.1 unnamed protein product [Lepeophtheirus salmonis]
MLYEVKTQDSNVITIYRGDKLYSIKWYRNGKEFYRFIPTDIPSRSIFNGDGIHVDQQESTETSVLLRNVDLNTTGKFRCEVSGEAPSFQTAYQDAILAVIDLPDDGPIITGGFPRYHIGDRVEVNCTSYRSKPAAKLKWYINGEQADPAFTHHFKLIKDKKWTRNKCSRSSIQTTIATIYWKSNEESVQGVRPQSALVSESRSGRKSSSSSSSSAVTHQTDYRSSSSSSVLFSSSSSLHSVCWIVLILHLLYSNMTNRL